MAIGLASSHAASAEPSDDLALPQISITHATAGSVAVAASVLGFADVDLKATLLVERSGHSGNASTRQSRDVHLEIGQRETIAEITITYLPGDRLFISVTIERDGTIISTATLAAGDRTAPDHTGDRR